MEIHIRVLLRLAIKKLTGKKKILIIKYKLKNEIALFLREM